jgi:hypothetical protein
VDRLYLRKEAIIINMLSAADVRQFRERGYLLYRAPLFSEEKLSRLQSIFLEHLDQKGDKLSDELDTPHFRDSRLFQFLLSDEVLNLVEPLLGPNILLWSSHFISKDPYTGRATPWHEDSAYWKGRLDDFSHIVTVWLALTPSRRENGCMRVIPGSHANGFSQYQAVDPARHTFAEEIADSIDETQAVYFELEPGQCSLHDGRIIHGAEANTSALRRTGYTMRYMSAATHIIPEANPGFRVWLARGENLGRNILAPLP